MIDYLALAMGQGEEENMEAAFFEIPTVEGRLPGEGPFWDEQLAQPSEAEKLGDLFSRKEAPQTPGKAPGGESFDSLSPWTPTLNDQRAGSADPSLWKPIRGSRALIPGVFPKRGDRSRPLFGRFRKGVAPEGGRSKSPLRAVSGVWGRSGGKAPP